MRCCPKCRNVPNERGIPWDEREIKEESYLEFRTQPMIEAALREARQEAAQEAPQPERTEQQDAACGMLPACAPLANPFVPFQRDDPPVYAAAVGAVRGTLFPGLDLPLRGQENSGELSGTLQRDLQALGFAVVELGEYLDTHPGDARAAELFRSYSGLYAQAAAAWEAENGPIVQRSAVGESGYDWLRGPWPWQYAAQHNALLHGPEPAVRHFGALLVRAAALLGLGGRRFSVPHCRVPAHLGTCGRFSVRYSAKTLNFWLVCTKASNIIRALFTIL